MITADLSGRAGKTEGMTVLLTGASGTLGGAVLPRLTGAGLDVRPMSRRSRPGWVAADLTTGDGLAEAVQGVDAVVHLASGGGRATAQTDVEGTRRLVAAAHRAGVRHVLYVSIVGIDRVPVAYYRAKLAAEEIVRDGGVPFTNLRATQFPQLVDTILTASSRFGPLVTDRNVLVQPVHVDDVAQRIAAQLAAGPAGGTVEFGGPEALPLGELARRWQVARGSRRPVLPIRVPGRIGRELRAGALTTSVRPGGTVTWDDYLAQQFSRSGPTLG
jgi:uncharacterized protein YbjT (DUF2867 family)